jgi:hypothetical protein
MIAIKKLWKIWLVNVLWCWWNIHLQNYQDIKEFLTEKIFNGCQKIYLNWVFHTDNDLIHYENKSVQERFPIIEYSPKNKKCKYNVKKYSYRTYFEC